MNVESVLSYGEENATPASELAKLLNCDERTLRQNIEAERGQGVPICANTSGDFKGYYLAKTSSELLKTITSLISRALTMIKTANALKPTFETMREKEDV